MTYPEINTLTSPLICLPINKPIISYSTYIRNKHKNLDCDYWRIHLSDRYIEFNPQYFYEIFNHHKSNSILSSATLNKIKSITNKYLADKKIYIPGLTSKPYYYYPSRGNSKSIREICYFIKSISDLEKEKNQFSYNPYSTEYTAQNYKADIENLYKRRISQKIINSYATQNNSTKQRSNNQEEMSCFKFIADRNKNNTNKKFHK
jgi:hypothetical protein|nr:MAG TPA: hypothetical protein [Caudoviricetes sp.]